jgi:DNA-binding phage protein
VHFGLDGAERLILRTGGTKRRPRRDVETARLWGRSTSGGGRKCDEWRWKIALMRSFKELMQTRVAADPAFGQALLREGIDAMLTGDTDTGKAILRDYIKATVGFEKLGEATGTQAKSLIRMFGPRGNPQARNLFSIIGYLKRQAGLELHVTQASG